MTKNDQGDADKMCNAVLARAAAALDATELLPRRAVRCRASADPAVAGAAGTHHAR